MKKISQILIESQKSRKQITGSYFLHEDEKDQNKITGYCAMGALACECDALDQGVFNLSFNNHLGIERTFLNPVICPCFDENDNRENCLSEYTVISDLIVHLNDYHEWSFEAIGTFFREQEDAGNIQSYVEIQS